MTAPDPISGGAIPALPPGEGWRFLASVLERCAWAVVGWSMAHPMRVDLVTQALSMALCQRQAAAGRSMQTERGRQDGADKYRQLLARHGRQPSMRRTGTCGDHAVAESVWHT